MRFRRAAFLILFSLPYFTLFAQVTVNDSNYIYIDSIYIYADSPINLKTTTSHIYLRNNAQLLQSVTNGDENTGLGSLSLYQTSNVSEYGFNYWCSPVGNNSINTNINNPFFLTLLGDPDSSVNILDYAPASFTTSNEGTNNPLVIAKRWIYTFESEGGANSSWNFIGDTKDIKPGLGFTMKGTIGSGNSQVYEFRGKPNSGSISNAVLEGKSTLIGNPYPSGIDAHSFIHDADNIAAIDGTLYFWEQDLSVLSHFTEDYVGGYATYTISSDELTETFIPAPFKTYNQDGTINTAGNGTGSKITRRHLSIGQGFMVNGKSGTSGTVMAKNSHRVYTNTLETPNPFFKTSKKQNDFSSAYMRFRINIDFDDVYTRQLVHNFNQEATDGFDYGLESLLANQLSNDAYWVQNEQAYVAQASSYNKDLSIPIVVNVASNLSLGFRLFGVQNFNSQQHIYLLDNETNMYYNLSSQNVLLSLEAGLYRDRFEIRFQSNPLSAGNEDLENSGLVAFFENELSEIKISNKKANVINKIFLYNINGIKVFSKNLKTQDELINIPVSHLSKGVYFLQCFTETKMANFKLMVE